MHANRWHKPVLPACRAFCGRS